MELLKDGQILKITGNTFKINLSADQKNKIDKIIVTNCDIKKIGDLSKFPNVMEIFLLNNFMKEISGLEELCTLKRLIVYNSPIEKISNPFMNKYKN